MMSNSLNTDSEGYLFEDENNDNILEDGEPKQLEPYDSTDELGSSDPFSENGDEDLDEWRALDLEYERQLKIVKAAVFSIALPLLGKLIGRRLALTFFPRVIRSLWPVK